MEDEVRFEDDAPDPLPVHRRRGLSANSSSTLPTAISRWEPVLVTGSLLGIGGRGGRCCVGLHRPVQQ